MELSVPSKSIPPPLPPKLPPEQRKKLSIVFEDSGGSNRESKRREEETDVDKLQDIRNNLPVVFLNDSSSTLISSQNEEDPLENGYLSLEFLQSMLIDSDSHKSDFSNTNADNTSCPPIPPKRTKSLKKASFRSSSGKSIGFEARSFALGSFHINYYNMKISYLSLMLFLC